MTLKTVRLLMSGLLLSAAIALASPREEVCLNGDAWAFQPVKAPFFGYELDAPERWQPSQRSHRFIVNAIEDPTNDWSARPVRVPMSWSCATSDPGKRDAVGDFAFPWFWQYVHRGVYQREFEVPATFAGKRIKLWFESVNFRCWIYVNDVLVRAAGEAGDFSHEGKHPFEVDISAAVRPAPARNRLRVVVHDFTACFAGKFPNEDHPVSGIAYPLGDRCDYYNKDRGWRNIDHGIIGDVILRAVAPVHVAEVFIRTSVKHSSLEADLTLRNESGLPRAFRLSSRIAEAASGKAVLPLDAAPEITLAAGETRVVTLRQKWPEPRLWWPHDPVLHRLVVELRDDRGVFSTHAERFGFREVEMIAHDDRDRRGFYLNGVRVRLLGESVEPTWKDGYTEGVGTSGLYLYNPEYWSMLIDEAKRLNMTVLRPHRGMWIKRMFEIADEKGMLMIAESTVNNGNHKGGNGTIENQRRALREMIVSLRNHPSIVIWSLANESPFDEAWADEARLHDRTRPYVATQTQPRNHPSPSLAAASGSYAMGLNGYQPNIYGRHDANWQRKPMYIYEDNACYDQPGDEERVGAVQKGLTIFRGHRSTGYEVISTFYTWQKLYGQPREPEEKHLRLRWTPEQIRGRGYRPDFARMPLLDPWTNPASPRIIRPIAGLAEPLDAFWQRTFSPVAVFDYDYDQRTDINANPYIAPLTRERTLTVHNDDLIDRTERIEVSWTVADFAGERILSRGSARVDVPLGGTRRITAAIEVASHSAVRVTYRAAKSGKERFAETIFLRAEATTPAGHIVAAAGQPVVAENGDVILMSALGEGVDAKGFRRVAIGGSAAMDGLEAAPVTETSQLQFNPHVRVAGDYDVYLHVPSGLTGTQAVEVLHDSINLTALVDLSPGGWLKVNAAPLRMQAGVQENAVRLTRGGTARRSVILGLKLVRVRPRKGRSRRRGPAVSSSMQGPSPMKTG